MKRLYAIRGATKCENTSEEILKAVHEMCDEIFTANNIKAEDMVSIQFSMTKDLNALNAAAALRKAGPCIDCSQVALFCTQEADIPGGMEKVVRVMITTYLRKKAKVVNVYKNGTDMLRPDRKSK